MSYFKVYYDGRLVKALYAETKYEAMERAYSALLLDIPELNRKLLKAKKIF